MQSARSDTRTAELRYFDATPKGIYPGMSDDEHWTVLTPGTKMGIARRRQNVYSESRLLYFSRVLPKGEAYGGCVNRRRFLDQLYRVCSTTGAGTRGKTAQGS
jgi:hypothetical protein